MMNRNKTTNKTQEKEMRMKTRIFTLFLLFATVLMFVPSDLHALDVVAPSELARPTSTTVEPSRSFLRKEKSADRAAMVSPLANEHYGFAALNNRSGSWEDLITGNGTQTGGAGSVGGPVGDATLPIVFSLLMLYIAYRGISTSRRKNEM